MGILVNNSTRIIVQGLTGKEGSFHTKEMITYGTRIVGGVTPGKGGITHMGIPVFNTVEEAINATNANVSIIFVPQEFAFDAIVESIYAGISIIFCVTEGIPILDMMKIKKIIKEKKTCLIGPNCPGIITSNIKIGIMPNYIFKKGNIGIVSKSGTLTYEVIDQLVKCNLGISSAIGIGGDPIIGTGIIDILDLFMKDNETKYIIIIGEIGGQLEIESVEYIKNLYGKKIKPIIGFIVGKNAPKGRVLGHAGAIVENRQDTAEFKIDYLKKIGISIIDSTISLGLELKKILSY
jgi:succinyl-CoA synthetase alpha subunit